MAKATSFMSISIIVIFLLCSFCLAENTSPDVFPSALDRVAMTVESPLHKSDENQTDVLQAALFDALQRGDLPCNYHFTAAGSTDLSNTGTARICMEESLGNPQFNFLLSFDSPCEVQFRTQPRAYERLRLWNGGADSTFTKLSHTVQVDLLQSAGVNLFFCESKPVSVFINNIYWGIYDLQEVPDRRTLSYHLDNVMSETPTIVNANGKLLQGDDDTYQEFINRLYTIHQTENTDILDHWQQLIDADSFLDCLAVQTFFGIADPTQIVYFQYPNRKWQCALIHLDSGLIISSYDALSLYLGQHSPLSTDPIIRMLMQAPENRELFLSKLSELYHNISTTQMQQRLDIHAQTIAPEIAYHWQRWIPYLDDSLNAELTSENADGPAYWQSRVDRMRNKTMLNRPYYVYQTVQQWFHLSDAEMEELFGSTPVLTELDS